MASAASGVYMSRPRFIIRVTQPPLYNLLRYLLLVLSDSVSRGSLTSKNTRTLWSCRSTAADEGLRMMVAWCAIVIWEPSKWFPFAAAQDGERSALAVGRHINVFNAHMRLFCASTSRLSLNLWQNLAGHCHQRARNVHNHWYEAHPTFNH